MEHESTVMEYTTDLAENEEMLCGEKLGYWEWTFLNRDDFHKMFKRSRSRHRTLDASPATVRHSRLGVCATRAIDR